MNPHTERIEQFRSTIERANNETVRKELLKDLLIDLFGNDDKARATINQMTLGAEKAVLNIPMKDRLKTGRADTQFGRTIIEFEFSMKKTGEHAVEQLAEYLLGNWHSGEEYPFTLIATDCVVWGLYAPDYDALATHIGTAADLKLKEVERFTLTPQNTDEFYYFLDRVLFRSEPLKPTLERIKQDFGDTSKTFISCFGRLLEHFNAVRNQGEVAVAFEQWERSLSIAYGAFKGDAKTFVVHTYLSIFAKIIAYQVLTRDTFIDEHELGEILNGRQFERLNVRNFIEQDFFGWVAHPLHFNALKPVFRQIASEVAMYDFTVVDEDILKGVYQELIDIDTRHALGEYYTPDWLCERVVAELNPQPGQRTLDPSCGSGSFLRAVVAHLRHANPSLTAQQLAGAVAGIDIHPLSVQIAKTTLLLAIGTNLLRDARTPVALPVYLANTLLVPERSTFITETNYTISVDGAMVELPQHVFENATLFDTAVAVCDELASDPDDASRTTVANVIERRQGPGTTLDESAKTGFHKLYSLFRTVKQEGRDSIWRFMVQNTYKPFFFRQAFDLVVGNPPWLTYSGVTVADYQKTLLELAKRYKVAPDNKANMPHLEIAAIFLAHCCAYFLKDTGRLAFVLPRSFFSADQHRNTRATNVDFLRVAALWDLDDVTPLFRVPSCVLVAERAPTNVKKSIPPAGLPGYAVAGRLPQHNARLNDVADRLTFRQTRWHLGELGERTAWTERKLNQAGKTSYYRDSFRQGATIVPRNFYFIEPVGPLPSDLHDRELMIRTDPAQQAEAKLPWKPLALEGRVHSDFLFRTAISKNILPFCLHGTMLTVLPLRPQPGGALALLTPEQIRNDGHLDTAKWFRAASELWAQHRTQNNANTTANQYLNWQQKLTNQNLETPFLILYNSSAQDANAVVVQPGAFDLPFVVDYRAYWFGTSNETEAHFLAAFLNANEPNRIIKDFQSRGLFGARDVSKTILDVPLPRYDSKNRAHQALAGLGKGCAASAAAFVGGAASGQVAGVGLGRLRSALRQHLTDQLQQIDEVLKEVL